MAGIEEGFLISTPLSPLYSQKPASISIRTSRQQLPLPPNPSDSDIHPEHATFSTLLTTSTHGTIVFRLLHGGLIAELASLSYKVPSVRFVFPAAILPGVGLFLVDSEVLHIVVVTASASLYRLLVKLDGRNLWKGTSDIIWPREHRIINYPENEKLLVHVEGTHSVTIALANASILRLEANLMKNDDQQDDWTETIFNYGSFLTSLTSYLPLQSGTSGGDDIVAMASHPWPTDLGHLWTLSRDRTLRLWKAKVGCVSSKNLTTQRGTFSASPSSSSNGIKQLLLDPSPRSLLRVFSHNERVYITAFIPTVPATSGGVFRLFDTYGDYLHDVTTFECPQHTTHSYLQDFIIHENVLYTLWERQGRSAIELAELHLGQGEEEEFQPSWRVAAYVNEPDLTPAYLEEQLLTPGSLTEKYLEALLRPGVFSSLTLKTAIDQYTDMCLSLPSAPPPQLTTVYATVEEQIAAVVGCTVNLNKDPQTGATQHAAYWVALKRDWEGFIARCREIERSARWPLTLGIKDHDGVAIMERERIGLLVNEDLPIQLQRLSLRNAILDPQYNLLAILWKLRSKVGPQAISTVQDRIVDILHQEIAFGFSDIIQDQARRIGFQNALPEGQDEWFAGRLESVGDLDTAVRTALDVIGGVDDLVKREDDEVATLIIPENPSDLSTGLTVAYILTTISARYDLCLSLMILLFFIAEDLSTWDPSLLAEVFAVFRGISMLRQISSQPVRSSNRQEEQPTERAGSEDVILRMRNMNFSNGGSVLAPGFSIVHLLLLQIETRSHPQGAAHHFLDTTGLLRSVSPSNATKHEVLFCERIRSLSLHDVARSLLAWLPRTPGVVFVLALVWLQLGRPADSAELLEKLASSFGPDCALSQDDRDALLIVVPSARAFDSSFTFYVYASEMFKNHSLVHYEVLFARLAISTAPPNIDTSALWYAVIKGYLDLGRYDSAYAALRANPYEKQKRECVSQLAFHMCENNAVESFMSFDFAGIAKEVEAALSFKARNVEPNSRPAYAHILYTWYVQKGNYRDGSLVMYQHALKLKAAIVDGASFVEMAQSQLEAIMIAINALSLVDNRNAWIVIPKSLPNAGLHRRLTFNHVPESKFSSRKHDVEIVHLSDMQYDCALLRAQIDLIRKDPSVLTSQEFLMPPALVVMRLVNMNFYEQALRTARALDVDMIDTFSQLTVHCLRLKNAPDGTSLAEGADWLLTDKVVSWSRTPAERGWNYLQQSLERHDSAQTDYRYSKTVLDTILTHDKGASIPPWLVRTLEVHHPEYLIRTALKRERVDLAVEYSLSMMQKAKPPLIRESSRVSSATTWLPYNLLDQVLVAAAEQPKPPKYLVELRGELNARLKRLQKLSQESH